MKVRIATYNLFEGARASYNRLVDFVRASSIDLLCLQEINGWQDAGAQRMQDFTDRGLFTRSAYGNSNTPYKLGTFSKLELVKSDAYIEGFWHSVVETRIALPGGQQLAILNVHLDPWQEQSRVRELDRLLRTIDRTLPTIVTGDLNSLSRRDAYGDQMLAELQRRGISKYGHSELEFTVTDYLEQAGFVDVAARLQSMRATTPTAATPEKDREAPVRIDYLFATPDIAACAQQAAVIVNDFTESISDHYPVVVDFVFPDTGVVAPARPAEALPWDPHPPLSDQLTSLPTAPIPAEPVRPSAPQLKSPSTVSHDEDGTVFIINHDD